MLFVGCQQEDPVQKFKKRIDQEYTLFEEFEYSDVRRYGLFVNESLGTNPINGKSIVNSVLDVAEFGIPLKFPSGYYLTSLRIKGRSNIELNFDDVTFCGTIEIQNSQDISFNGTLNTLEQFYSRDSEKIKINQINIKKDTIKSLNRRRPAGCSIHSGTREMTIGKLIVEDVGSGTPEFKYVKGGLVIHGHNNEPEEIKIDSAIIKNSDRHGAYITGDEISISYLLIEKFGVGSSQGMAKMEGGIEGEQLEFAGLWIKNCFDSSIKRTDIKLDNSKGTYSLNMDYGELFRPVVIDSVLLIGNRDSLKEKFSPRTGVKIKFLK